MTKTYCIFGGLVLSPFSIVYQRDNSQRSPTQPFNPKKKLVIFVYMHVSIIVTPFPVHCKSEGKKISREKNDPFL